MSFLTAGMVRGMKGAPASIILLLSCTHQALSNGYLAANTGYTDKTIALGLVYLGELGFVIQVRGGWLLARDVDAQQLPFLLPTIGAQTDAQTDDSEQGNSFTSMSRNGSDSASTDDGDQNSIITSTSRNESDSSYGGGVVLNKDLNRFKDSVLNNTTTMQPSRNESDSARRPALSADDAGRVKALLEKLGCWDNRIGPIVAGLHPLRGVGIVLGWIAYSRDPDSDVHNPPAVIAGHLTKGLEPASKWIPPRICRACHLAEGLCACGAVDFFYPADFDDLAFEAPPAYGHDAWVVNRWRCDVCGGHPCQCEGESDAA